jgi:hypothetical protein
MKTFQHKTHSGRNQPGSADIKIPGAAYIPLCDGTSKLQEPLVNNREHAACHLPGVFTQAKPARIG